jgi:hypothetical protein
LEDLGLSGRILLKWILVRKAWIGLMSLMIRTSGRTL